MVCEEKNHFRVQGTDFNIVLFFIKAVYQSQSALLGKYQRHVPAEITYFFPVTEKRPKILQMLLNSGSPFQCTVPIFDFDQCERDSAGVSSYGAIGQPFQCYHVKSGVAVCKFNVGYVIVCAAGNFALVIVFTRNYLLELSFVFGMLVKPPVHRLLIKRKICDCFCGRWISAKACGAFYTVVNIKRYRERVVDFLNFENTPSTVIDIHGVSTKLQV